MSRPRPIRDWTIIVGVLILGWVLGAGHIVVSLLIGALLLN